MNSAPPVPPSRWPRARLWGAIAVIFGLQLALIFRFSERSSAMPRPLAPGPLIHMSQGDANDLLLVEDPALFVLPHRDGFSGRVWLTMPAQKFQPWSWSEKPRWLRLAAKQLGAGFVQFAQTNVPPRFLAVALPEPEQTQMPRSAPIAAKSRLRIVGDLAAAGRRLVSPLELRAWPNGDLLTNSVVQVLVDAQGNTFSRRLIQGCGRADIDQQALELAKGARFDAWESAGPGRDGSREPAPTAGEMIFEWQTLAMPPASASPGGM